MASGTLILHFEVCFSHYTYYNYESNLNPMPSSESSWFSRFRISKFRWIFRAAKDGCFVYKPIFNIVTVLGDYLRKITPPDPVCLNKFSCLNNCNLGKFNIVLLSYNIIASCWQSSFMFYGLWLLLSIEMGNMGLLCRWLDYSSHWWATSNTKKKYNKGGWAGQNERWQTDNIFVKNRSLSYISLWCIFK